MRVYIIFLLGSIIACYGLPTGDELPASPAEAKAPQRVEFSPTAKYLLKEASLRAISYLCFGENVNEEIYETICKKAITNLNNPDLSRTLSGPSQANNCIDCDVADPICWDACPQ